MYKKYKIRKRPKNKVNIYSIFLILAIICIIVTYAYAYYSDVLNLIINATFIPPSNSTYVWGFPNNNYQGWGGGNANSPRTYQPIITITNKDGELSGWTVSFEVGDGVVADSVTTWTNTASVSGNTVTLGSLYNETIPNNGTIELNFQIQFTNKNPLVIKNLRLNGRWARCLGMPSYAEEPEEPTNNTTNNTTNSTTNNTTNTTNSTGGGEIVTPNFTPVITVGEPMNWGTTATQVTVVMNNTTNLTRVLQSLHLHFTGSTAVINSVSGNDGKSSTATEVEENEYLVTISTGSWASEIRANGSQTYTFIVRSDSPISQVTVSDIVEGE